MTPAPVPAPAPPAAKPATSTATQQTAKPETAQVDSSIVSKTDAQDAFGKIYKTFAWDVTGGKHPSGSGSVP